MFAIIERGTVGFHHIVAQSVSQSLGAKFFSKQLSGSWMSTDFFLHQGLRQARGVLLVVAQFTEADDVNHNIFAELHPVFQCQLGR